jgi:hypothetical protein
VIPGIVASQHVPISSAPLGSIADINLVGNSYWLDGDRAFADLINGATNDGGIHITSGNENRPVATALLRSAFSDLLSGGFTLVIEWHDSEGILDDTAPIFAMFDDQDNDNLFAEVIDSFQTPGGSVSIYDSTFEMEAFTDAGQVLMPGVNRMAATFGLDIGGGDFRSGVTVNGNALGSGGSDDVNYSNAFLSPLGDIHFGGVGPWSWVYNGCTLRRITLYEARPVDDLPALSAV